MFSVHLCQFESIFALNSGIAELYKRNVCQLNLTQIRLKFTQKIFQK